MTASAIPPAFWNQYPAVFHPTRPPTALGSAGGLSGSELWKVESALGLLMVRAWPTDGPDPSTLGRIHRRLNRACRWTILPIPIPNRMGTTWVEAQGRLWELTPFLPGAADLGRPPTDAHLGSMFRTLAAFHNELGSEILRGPSPGLVARRDEVGRLIGGEFDRFQTALERRSDDPRTQLASSWLGQARRIAPRLVAPLRLAAVRSLTLQPCIRDVRPDHFLFEGDILTGLVDFGAMGIDTVATDLARLLGETVGRSRGSRRIAFEAYEAVRPITEGDRAILDHFEAANALLGGARWVRGHFIDHRRFPDSDAVAQGLNRALARLEDYWNEPV